MDKLPSSPSTNPFTKSEASPRAATASFGDGIKIKSGLADAFTEMRSSEASSGLAGMSFGSPASTKTLESGDHPAPKKNPFQRKPLNVKPSEAKLGSESGNAQTAGPDAKVVTTKSGLEVDQVSAASADDFDKRVKEAQKPVSSADMEMNSENYAKVYQVREQERIETEKKKAEEEARIKQAQNGGANSQEQMMKNAALAQQARDLNAKMAHLKSQLGGGDDASTWASIEECRVALAQIPSGLQG